MKMFYSLVVLVLLNFTGMANTNLLEAETNSSKSRISITPTDQDSEIFILIHSAWLGAWQWDVVANYIREDGHRVITPDLPGHGVDTTFAGSVTMDLYVKTIIDILDQQKKPVILVGHSFNGITISRVAELRPDMVKKMVYLAGLMVPNYESFLSSVHGMTNSVAVDNFCVSEDSLSAYVKEKKLHKAFAHDIPKDVFKKVKPSFVSEPFLPLQYRLEVTDKNYGRVTKYYIECTEDNTIPIAVQRSMYEGNVKDVFSIKSSHTPNFSKPFELAEILLQIVEEY